MLSFFFSINFVVTSVIEATFEYFWCVKVGVVLFTFQGSWRGLLALCRDRRVSLSHRMDAEGNLPPPPPVPEGAVPAIAPGFGAGDGSLPAGPSGGNNGSGNGAGRNGGKNGGGPNGGSGSAALAALALLPAVPIPPKATRPAFGRAGRPTDLCVNHFKARLTKSEDVFHYNVSFTRLSRSSCCLCKGLWA